MFKNSLSRKGSPGGSPRNVPHTRVEDENEIEQIYEFRRELGRGSFGRVYEAQCQKTGMKWAVKAVNKEKAGSYAVKLLEREVNIMKMIDHDHVICLNEVYETPTKMFLVMELCDRGELCDLLKKRKTLKEHIMEGELDRKLTKPETMFAQLVMEALTVIRQLADALAYLHDLDIVHRDLKLENILLCQPVTDEPLNIKISDFGLSYVKGSGEAMMQSVCGTPIYMAPEVIDEHEYSRQCDIWSIGVILYILLTGSPPFQAQTEEKLYQLIKKGELDFTHPCWQTVNESAKNLLEGMLEVDPAHRSTAKEIQDHPWINGDTESSGRRNVIQMMREYNLEQKKINNTNHNYNSNETMSNETTSKEIEPTETSEQPSDEIKKLSSPSSKTSLRKDSKDRKKSPGAKSSRVVKSQSTSHLQPFGGGSSQRDNNNTGKAKSDRPPPSYMQPTQSSSSPSNPGTRSTSSRNRRSLDKAR